jgi:hypothetical protein
MKYPLIIREFSSDRKPRGARPAHALSKGIRSSSPILAAALEACQGASAGRKLRRVRPRFPERAPKPVMSEEINPYNAGTLAPSGSPFAPSAGELSEIVYELDVDDFVAFGIFHLYHSPAERPGRRLVTAIFVILAVVCALTANVPWARGDRVGSVFFLSLAGLCAALPFTLFPWLTRRYARHVFRGDRNRAMLGARRLRISRVGLSDSSELLKTSAKWAAVERIETNAGYAYLYIGAAQAYVIPRRAFNDDAQFLAFVELARRYWREATGGTVADSKIAKTAPAANP